MENYPSANTPASPVAQPLEKAAIRLKVSDIVCILAIGEAFALLVMVIRRNLGVQVPEGILYSLPIIVPLAALFCLWAMAMLGRKKPVLFQIGKYAAIGFLNTGIDLGVFNALVIASNIDPKGIKAGLLSACSFTVAVVNSYLWNKYWTFRDKGKAKGSEFMQFVIVSLIGLLLNFVYVSAVTNYVNPPFDLNLKQWANLVKFMGIFISLAWNFVGYKFIVFKEKKDVATA
jgi:putative flippase GtrA